MWRLILIQCRNALFHLGDANAMEVYLSCFCDIPISTIKLLQLDGYITLVLQYWVSLVLVLGKVN